jgi:hypothetical protein
MCLSVDYYLLNRLVSAAIFVIKKVRKSLFIIVFEEKAVIPVSAQIPLTKLYISRAI